MDLRKTKLKNRILWFDGTTAIPASELLTTNIPFSVVDEITDSVCEYNRLVSKDHELRIKSKCDPLEYNWNIPPYYKTLEVNSYLFDKLISTTPQVSEEEFNARAHRLAEELKLYQHYNLYDVLRTLIYIINTLTVNNAVWGIGRGSSVSSYVLFLIGTHDVDSVAYDLDITDFLHD